MLPSSSAFVCVCMRFLLFVPVINRSCEGLTVTTMQQRKAKSKKKSGNTTGQKKRRNQLLLNFQ